MTVTDPPTAARDAPVPATVRLTTAQALVRWMVAQRSELLDGTEVPLFAGVFAIFGHGNVLGLGTALHAVRDVLPTWRGQTEQGMALAAVAYAKATRPASGDGRDVLGRAGRAEHGHRGGVAHANRLPVLLLPGDTFTGRAPDPVLQQVEHFGDPTSTVNDAFRAVSRYFDRITRPEQLLATLPQVARVLTDPADGGPVVLALPQDVQAEEYDFPAAMFAPRLHRVPRPRPDADALAEAARRAAGGASSAARGRRRRALLGRGRGRLLAFAQAHGVPVVETTAGRTAAAAAAPAERRPARASSARRRRTRWRPGGRRARRRHPAAGLHHRVVDGVRARRPAGHRQRRPVRRGQARRRSPWSVTPGRPSPSWTALLAGWSVGPGLDRAAPPGRARALGRPGRPAAGRRRTGRLAELRAGGRRGQRRQRAGRLRDDLLRRDARRAGRRLAHGSRVAAGPTMDTEYGFSCMGYELSGAVGRGDGAARGPIRTGWSPTHARRRLVPDAQLRAVLRGLRRAPVRRRGLRQRRLRGDPPAADRPGRRRVQQPVRRLRRARAPAAGLRVDFAAHARALGCTVEDVPAGVGGGRRPRRPTRRAREAARRDRPAGGRGLPDPPLRPGPRRAPGGRSACRRRCPGARPTKGKAASCAGRRHPE